MSTRTAICWLLASLFAASSGCLSLDQSGTFSSLDLRSKRGAAQPTFASEDLPRFRSPGKPADTPSQDAGSSVASFETSPSNRKFDATTMALIESELRDSDPADRKEWLEYLSSVEPEVVPHLLKARRLELNQRREQGAIRLRQPSLSQTLRSAHRIVTKSMPSVASRRGTVQTKRPA